MSQNTVMCITLFNVVFILFSFFSSKSDIPMSVFHSIKLNGFLQRIILDVSLLLIFISYPISFSLTSFHSSLPFIPVNIPITLTVIQVNELS
jgi:hypothetical protein